MPVFLVPHAIQSPPRLRVRPAKFLGKRREIVHASRPYTHQFVSTLVKHIDFLVFLRRRFHLYTIFFRLAIGILGDVIRCLTTNPSCFARPFIMVLRRAVRATDFTFAVRRRRTLLLFCLICCFIISIWCEG